MPNPFDAVGIERKESSNFLQGWDEVGGTFSCDDTGCDEKSNVAFYSSAKQELRWTCRAGHVTVLQGFVL